MFKTVNNFLLLSLIFFESAETSLVYLISRVMVRQWAIPGAFAGSSYSGGGKKMSYTKKRRYGGIPGGGRATARANARSIARLNKRYGGFIGLELKFLDLTLAPTAIASNGDLTGGEYDPATTLCLNAMIQGTTESARIGRFISMKSMTVKGRVVFPGLENMGAPPIAAHVVCYLILDTQANEAGMKSEDVFVNKGATTTMTGRIFRNLEHTDRYQVLDSFKAKLTPMSLVDDPKDTDPTFAHATVHRDFTLSYRWNKGKKVLFSGTGATISSIQDNALHVIAFSTNGTLTIEFNSRCRYTTS